MFIVSNHDQHDTSKTLINANQCVAPRKYFISVTCFPSKETKLRLLMIPFAVADIKKVPTEHHSLKTQIEKLRSNIQPRNSSSPAKIKPQLLQSLH